MATQPANNVGLDLDQCIAMGDEWAMLSRRSEKWQRLASAFERWVKSRDERALGIQHRLQTFLDQRHALSQGWNKAYRNNWTTRFNDFYIYYLTERVAGY